MLNEVVKETQFEFEYQQSKTTTASKQWKLLLLKS